MFALACRSIKFLACAVTQTALLANTALWLFLLLAQTTIAGTCAKQGVVLQVLGSGGPELSDQRASSGYLVWQDGKAKVLVDLGTGSLQVFEQSGAAVEDLQLILLTHLHVDHSADLPGLVKGSYFTARESDLPLYGPTGNFLMPDTESFITTMFGNQGTYRYLNDFLDGSGQFTLRPHNVLAKGKEHQEVLQAYDFKISAVPVRHGPVPALAWRVELGGHSLVFSGDMSGANNTLAGLASRADLLVAHNAVPEEASGAARALHMPPSVIGQIASAAQVKQLVLSHRMRRTLGKESSAQAQIRNYYAGPLSFADDGDCYPL